MDEGDFFELSASFARNIVIGFGRIAGRTVGFVANQPMVLAGVLDSSERSENRARRLAGCRVGPGNFTPSPSQIRT